MRPNDFQAKLQQLIAEAQQAGLPPQEISRAVNTFTQHAGRQAAPPPPQANRPRPAASGPAPMAAALIPQQFNAAAYGSANMLGGLPAPQPAPQPTPQQPVLPVMQSMRRVAPPQQAPAVRPRQPQAPSASGWWEQAQAKQLAENSGPPRHTLNTGGWAMNGSQVRGGTPGAMVSPGRLTGDVTQRITPQAAPATQRATPAAPRPTTPAIKQPGTALATPQSSKKPPGGAIPAGGWYQPRPQAQAPQPQPNLHTALGAAIAKPGAVYQWGQQQAPAPAATSPAGPAGTLQANFDRANEANENRYQQLLEVNQYGGQQQLADMNQSYAGQQQMLADLLQQRNQMLSGQQSQLLDRNAANTQAAVQGAGVAGGALVDQRGQQMQQLMDLLTGQNQSLQEQRQGQVSGEQGLLADQYAQMMGLLTGQRDEQQGIVQQGGEQLRGLLSGQSDAAYEREARRRREQLGALQQQMVNSGLANTTVGSALQRGIYDDSALREAEIGDRRLQQQLGIEQGLLGQQLGIAANSGQQMAGYAGSNMNQQFASLAGANRDTSNINQQWQQLLGGAMQGGQRDQANLANQWAQTGYGAMVGGNADAMNLASQFAGLFRDTQQGGANQQMQLANQYAGNRGNLLQDLRMDLENRIEGRTDAGPDLGMWAQLMSQPGAAGGIDEQTLMALLQQLG